MAEFDFSSLLEQESVVDSKTKKQAEFEKPTLTKKPLRPKSTKVKVKKELVLGKVSDLIDQEDIDILRILAKKYKEKGTNVVRHNQKNPFVQDLARLAFLVQQLDTFKQMHKEGLVAKTKYSGQWSIR